MIKVKYHNGEKHIINPELCKNCDYWYTLYKAYEKRNDALKKQILIIVASVFVSLLLKIFLG